MFDNNVSVLIPYKESNDVYRQKSWEWIKRRYETIMPNAEICMGYYNEEPFNRSAAINDAAKKATRDIFIIADADIAFNIDQIENAIEALNFHPWVIPYRSRIHLSLEKTNELYKKNPSITLDDSDIEGCEILGLSGYQQVGAIIIVPRNNFEKVGGFDERFKGWGREDDAFAMAMNIICGQYFRVETTMWHLYHPLQSQENIGNNDNVLNKFYHDKEIVLHNFNNKVK